MATEEGLAAGTGRGAFVTAATTAVAAAVVVTAGCTETPEVVVPKSKPSNADEMSTALVVATIDGVAVVATVAAGLTTVAAATAAGMAAVEVINST